MSNSNFSFSTPIHTGGTSGTDSNDSQILSLIFDTANIGICVTDEQGNFVRVNRAYCKQYGYLPEELLGKHFSLVIPPDARNYYRILHSEMIAGVTHELAEAIVMRKDGAIRNILVTAAILASADGRRYKITTVTDVTERKHFQEEILLRDRAFAESRNGIIISDYRQPDMPIIDCNAAFERMSGYSQSETLGRNCRFLQGKDTDQAARRKLHAAVQDRRECNVVILNYRKDGTPFWNELSISPVRDADGLLTHYIGIQSDVTERKTLEDRLMRTQRMESLATLTSGIAHDINNVLAPIVTGLEMLQQKVDDEKTARRITGMLTSAKRGAGLVSKMLSFAKGGSGERKAVDTTQLLRDAERFIKDTFPKSVIVRTSIPDGLRQVLGNSTELDQVLINLCINASDAMPTGGTLTLNAENLTIDENYALMKPGLRVGTYVCIRVSDTGIGIAPDVLERMFEPFFTTKPLDKGTGLGLAILFSIVKSLNGHIEVDTAEGKGSTFGIYLPVFEGDGAEEVVHQNGRSAAGNGQLILVVEDEEVIREISEEMLTGAGYRVVTASDGAEAIAVYAEHKQEIRLVITDIMMPVMDGIASIHVMRRLNPAIRVIAVSGLMDSERQQRLTELGVYSMLAKPYTSEKLLKAVAAALRDNAAAPV